MATFRKDELTEYLLGRLPESERDRLESSWFADTARFDELVDAENDLIDRYAAGRLAGDDRARFEQYYLTTPERRRRVEFARALSAKAAERRPAEAKSSWWSTLWLPAPRLALAGAALGIALSLGWVAVSNQRLAESRRQAAALQSTLATEKERFERELAAARQAQGSAPMQEAVRRAVSLVLSAAGVSRADGETPTLRMPADATDVRLRMPLETQGGSFVAVLESAEGRALWKSPRIVAQSREATAVVPVSVLSSGDYLLRLSSASGDSVADFAFRITR